MSGPGQIDTKLNARPMGADTTPTADINLSNFDIDHTEVKQELRDHLVNVVIPALKKNGTATVKLVGSADRQGDEIPGHNLQLSRERANAIKKILNANGISAQVTDSQGAGAPLAGPLDNPADRGVRIELVTPTKIEAITLHTDDWIRQLKWDDVVGLKGADGRAIERFNIQVRISGAPRLFMPETFLLQQPVETYIPQFVSHWNLPVAPKSVQPSDDNVTSYRDSGPLNKFNLADRNASKVGFAIINRATVPIDFRIYPLGFVNRGVAAVNVPGSEMGGEIGPEQLLRAGGVERFFMTGPDKIVVKWFVRRPATIFAFSNNGTRDGCLSSVGECWASPKMLQEVWKNQKDMRALILAAPFILKMNIVNGSVAMGGPGAEWAKMLENRNGPFQAIVGYDDDAPDIGSVGADIAKRFGTIMHGLTDGAAFVDAWLSINAEHDGKNTWNAVGMDKRGYKWIVAQKPDFRDKEFYWPPWGGDKPVIAGPVPIM